MKSMCIDNIITFVPHARIYSGDRAKQRDRREPVKIVMASGLAAANLFRL